MLICNSPQPTNFGVFYHRIDYILFSLINSEQCVPIFNFPCCIFIFELRIYEPSTKRNETTSIFLTLLEIRLFLQMLKP